MISIINNEYVLYFILGIFIILTLASLFRIFLPNYSLKQYISQKWDMPNDNWTRFWGLVFLFIYGYVVLYLLGYIK